MSGASVRIRTAGPDDAAGVAAVLALGFAVVGSARGHARVSGRDVDVLFIERPLKEG